MRKAIVILSIVVCLFFSAFGGLFLLIAGFMRYTEQSFKNNGVAVMAEITYILPSSDDSDYSVFVEFEYNDETYSAVELGMYSSSMYVGQLIEVYYRPDTTGILYVDGTHKLMTIFTVVGAVIVGIGVASFITGFVASRFIRPLKEYGTKYTGYVQQLEFLSSIYTTGFGNYIVHATYTDNYGVSQHVKSGPVQINPPITLPLGSPIDVYVDPKNPSRYLVDALSAVNALYRQPGLCYKHY